MSAEAQPRQRSRAALSLQEPEPSSSQALAAYRPEPSLPPEKRALVAVDTRGQVVPAWRRMGSQLAAYGALGMLGTIGAYTIAIGDPLIMVLSLVGTAAWGHGILVTRWLERSSSLILQGKLDEAQHVLERLLHPPWGSDGVRAHAYLRLAALLGRRGQHLESVDAAADAEELFEREYPPQPQFVALSRYSQVRGLVSAGELADARYRMSEIQAEDPPIGDFLRGQFHVTELYLALADDRLALSETDLLERSKLARDTTGAEPLYFLCAWGLCKLGHRSLGKDLLDLGHKHCGEPLDQTLPLLKRWVSSQHPRP